MRTSRRSRKILPAVLAVLLLPAMVLSQEEKPKAKIQKKPVAQEPSKSGTQTAPAEEAGKGKEKGSKEESGLHAIEGTVVQVFPDRHAITVRTSAKDYQVYVTPQTVLERDGQRAGIKDIQPGDRVDSCHFNAKSAIQKMSVSSPGKAAATPPAATGKP